MHIRNCGVLAFCFVLFSMLVLGQRTYAQDSSNSNEDWYLWLDLGGGGSWVPAKLGYEKDDGGLSGEISLYYQHGSSLYSVRCSGTAQFIIDIFGTGRKPESISEIGVLYGRVAKSKIAAASASIGMSYIINSYDTSTTTIGIPMEGQVIFTPLPIVGIGLKVFGNLNPQKSFLGGLICFQLGKLW